MSSLRAYIVDHPLSSGNPGNLLKEIDIDQFARIPAVGEFIELLNFPREFKVNRVKFIPSHGVVLSVESI
jgi:hypothetical protein